jgi:hypothetical protein
LAHFCFRLPTWRRAGGGSSLCEHHGNSCIPHQLELPTRCGSFTMSFARSFARNKPLNFFVAIV